MVHYNVKYGTFVDAVDKYDGLAVLAVLMEVSVVVLYQVNYNL